MRSASRIFSRNSLFFFLTNQPARDQDARNLQPHTRSCQPHSRVVSADIFQERLRVQLGGILDEK